MQTGFVLFDGKSEPVARYEVNDWNSEDSIEGAIYGIEKLDLYLFSLDELNGGPMQIGKNIAMELEDGVFHFGFASNGKVFGNRNQLQKKDDMYYINGLRLEADEEYGYGVVKVKDGAGIYYQMVDVRGEVAEGTKKIAKDKDGGWLLITRSRLAIWYGDEDKLRWRRGTEGTEFYHYGKGNKEDHFVEGLIAAADTEPDIDSPSKEEWLNFQKEMKNIQRRWNK